MLPSFAKYFAKKEQGNATVQQLMIQEMIFLELPIPKTNKNSDQIEQEKKMNLNYMIKATHDATRVILFAKKTTRAKKKSTDDKNSDF